VLFFANCEALNLDERVIPQALLPWAVSCETVPARVSVVLC
jgi:hypothetical protein